MSVLLGNLWSVAQAPPPGEGQPAVPAAPAPLPAHTTTHTHARTDKHANGEDTAQGTSHASQQQSHAPQAGQQDSACASACATGPVSRVVASRVSSPSPSQCGRVLQDNLAALLRGYQQDACRAFIMRDMGAALGSAERGLQLLAEQPDLPLDPHLQYLIALTTMATAPTLAMEKQGQQDPMRFLTLFQAATGCGGGATHPPATPLTVVHPSFAPTWSAAHESHPSVPYSPELVTSILARVSSALQLLQECAVADRSGWYAKMLLVEAERQRLVLQSHMSCPSLFASAGALYCHAIAAAQQFSSLADESMAHELYARFLIGQGWSATAGPAARQLRDAYNTYHKWGATLKLRQLEKEFAALSTMAEGAAESPALWSEDGCAAASSPAGDASTSVGSNATSIASTSNRRMSFQSGVAASPADFNRSGSLNSSPATPPLHPPTASPSLPGSPHTRPPSSLRGAVSPSRSSTASADVLDVPPVSLITSMPQQPDVLAILKATQTFSLEKDRRRLLEKLMTIVLEHAGAAKGVLVLEDPDAGPVREWRVELAATVAVPTTAATEGRANTEQQTDRAAATDSVDEAAAATASTDQHALPLILTAATSPMQDRQSSAAAPWKASSLCLGHGSSFSAPPSPSLYPLARSPSIHIHLDDIPPLADALPVSVFQFVLQVKEAIVLSEPEKLAAAARAAAEAAAAANDGETTEDGTDGSARRGMDGPLGGMYDQLVTDTYFQHHQPKALLCCPVLKQGDVMGVLYLEHPSNASAFSATHIQMLQLLCSQLALSVDNSRLYNQLALSNSNLEATVAQRTLELQERNEQLVLAKEMAEKLMLTKSDFLSNMSHELRTPMNAVLGISRLLADTPLSLEQDQYLSMITNSGHLLLTIINDILDYSKIEAGQLKLEKGIHSLVDTVETAVLLCHDAASTKGLDLHFWVQPDAPHTFLVDATRLQQVLLNLLSNAIKFTRDGSVALTVSAAPVAVAPLAARITTAPLATPPSAGNTPPQLYQQLAPVIASTPSSKSALWELTFHIKDEGIGISDTDMSKLFQSFSQAKHISSKYGGTGLGLVISKRLVRRERRQATREGTASCALPMMAEAMGGRIWCQSKLGVGSIFSFSIQVEAHDLPLPRLNAAGSRISSPLVANQADVPMWPPVSAPTVDNGDGRATTGPGDTSISGAASKGTEGGTSSSTIVHPFTPTLPFSLREYSSSSSSGITMSALSSRHSSPANPVRSLSSTSTSCLAINPFQLSDPDVELLRNSRVLFLCKRAGSMAVWAQLLAIYGCATVTESSPTAALQVLQEAHASTDPRARISLFILEGFDSWSLGHTSAFNEMMITPSGHRILSDGSSPQAMQQVTPIEEEPVEELLDPSLYASVLPCAPLSLLFLTDRFYHPGHSSPFPSSSTATGVPSTRTPPPLGSARSIVPSVSLPSLSSNHIGAGAGAGASSNGGTSTPGCGSSSVMSLESARRSRVDGVAAGLALGMGTPIVSPGDAAVAKLQTRSPAVIHRRLGGARKESIAAHPLHTVSTPTPVLPTALPLLAPVDTHALEAPSHAPLTGGSKSALTTPGSAPQLHTAELSMPFKLRDFLLCILRQLYRMQEATAVRSVAAADADAPLPAQSSSPVRSSGPNSSPNGFLPSSSSGESGCSLGGRCLSAASAATGSSSLMSDRLLMASQVSAATAVLSAGGSLPVASRQVAPPTGGTMAAGSSAGARARNSAGGPGGRSLSSKREYVPIAPIAKAHPLRILLTEDNLINQKMMVMLLRKLGYEILVASHGRECLEILEREAARGSEHQIQCVLMDASMDVMDGEECTRVIRMQQLPHRTRPYIIAQTANVSEEFKRRCLDAGMDQYISKPISLDELVRVLKDAYRWHQNQKASAHALQEAAAQAVNSRGGSTVTSPEPPAPRTVSTTPRNSHSAPDHGT